ncbi:MAG TPA: hypothetical protein VF382_04505 [Actinomycetota bacterium]
MDTTSGTTDEGLSPTPREAGRRPGDLQYALVQTEQAVLGTTTGGLDVWTGEVASALGQLQEAIEVHIELAERPGGLNDEIRHKAPRLSSRVKRLQREHPILHARIEELMAFLHRPGVGDKWPPDEARDDIRRLLRMVERHRQSTADVVWEAYHLDIGGVE